MVCKRMKLRFFTNFYNKKQKNFTRAGIFIYKAVFEQRKQITAPQVYPPSKVRQLIRNTAAHILVYRDY